MTDLTSPLFALAVILMVLVLYLITSHLRSLERKIDRLELKIAEILAEIGYLRHK